jgi:hypothetical protein
VIKSYARRGASVFAGESLSMNLLDSPFSKLEQCPSGLLPLLTLSQRCKTLVCVFFVHSTVITDDGFDVVFRELFE